MAHVSSPLFPLERTLLGSLRQGGLLPAGSTGLVSVSGGADSTALLLLLHALAGRLEIALEVVTFDHGLREESAREAEWVRALAGRLGRPCHVRRGFERAGAAGDARGIQAPGIQAAARAWRRRESLALLRERGAGWIATGHQREDHWETLLLKLLRGAHLSRLRGMAERHGPWVRPLLAVRRAELEAYLRGRGQDWLEDPSNLSPKYKRNRVRNELVPLLESLAPGGIGARLDALERQSRALAEWIATVPPPPRSDPVSAAHWIDAAALRALSMLPREALLHDFLAARMPGLVDAATLERAATLIGQDAPWELHLSARRTLRGRGARVLLERREAEGLVEREAAGYRVRAPGRWRVHLTPQPPFGRLRAGSLPGGEGERLPPHPPAPSPKGEGRPFPERDEEHRATIVIHNLDAANPLTVRPREAGDRILLPGEAGPVKVAELLRESGVPLWDRERVPIVLSGDVVVAVFPDWLAAGHEAPTGQGESLAIAVTQGAGDSRPD